MNNPSEKTIREGLQVSAEVARAVRVEMDSFRRRHGHRGIIPTATLDRISTLLDMFGRETIPKGHNAKSPRIDYVNTGDTYKTTVLFVNGRFAIGCWGDIVERGNYK